MTVFETTGGERSVPVEETLAKLRAFVRPGLIEGVQYVNPYGQDWCHVAHANLAAPLTGGRKARLMNAAGKGGTAREAIVSALAEGVERLSFLVRPSDVEIFASYEEISGRRALRPNEIDGFSERQLARGPLDADDPARWIPRAFDPAAKIEWSRAWSMTDEEFVLVPTQQVHYDPAPKHDFCRANTNGLSAGNTVDECLVQGFLELVERDALAIWWSSRLARPELDVSAAARAPLRDAGERFARLDRGLRFLDLTHDLGIPVVAAMTWMKKGPAARIAIAAGCHFDAEIAALRAVTELGQWLRNFELAERNPAVRLDELQSYLFREARFEDLPFLTPCDAKKIPESPPVGRGVDDLLEVTKKAGLELIVKNVSRTEFDFPVVKVIVPGLVMHWPRFGQRRLFDVPVRMGWRSSPLSENELNPRWWSA